MNNLRRATYSGSWYDSDEHNLANQFLNWLEHAQVPAKPTRIVIVPHAGYQYSARTAAFSYKALRNGKYRRIFILGPSHREYFKGIRCSHFDGVSTPLGTLKCQQAGFAEPMSSSLDLHEHCLEMQFPFIKHLFPDTQIIPILVGDVNNDLVKIANNLAEELKDKDTAMVVTSDFCHWGPNYQFMPMLEELYSSEKSINGRIRAMDQEAQQIIASGNIDQFKEYFHFTGNTICGRYPIMLIMKIIGQASLGGHWEWLHYEQSNPELSKNGGNSVSYSAGAFYECD